MVVGKKKKPSKQTNKKTPKHLDSKCHVQWLKMLINLLYKSCLNKASTPPFCRTQEKEWAEQKNSIVEYTHFPTLTGRHDYIIPFWGLSTDSETKA